MNNYNYTTKQQKSNTETSVFDFSQYVRLKNNPCPVCNRKDSGCMTHGIVDGYAICTKISENAIAEFPNSHFGYNYIHKTSFSAPVIAKKMTKWGNDVKLASPETLHKQYSKLKNKYKISEEDKNYLWGAGILDTSRYFTIPEPPDKSTMGVPVYDSPEEGIPGYYKRNGQDFLNLNFWGLAVACYDDKNRIIGIEIRLSESCKAWHANRLKKSGEHPGKLSVVGKSIYRPLTSPWGAKVQPQQKISVWTSSSETLWITEGIKKGQVLHDSTNDNVISVIGVGNWLESYKMAIKLKADRPKIRRVIVAFDMDRLNTSGKHGSVANAHNKLIEYLCAEHTMSVCVADWDPQYKGIDDLLNAGIMPNITPLDNTVYSGIDTAREELTQKFSELLLNPNKKLNVFQVSAGVGKTYAIIDAINKLDADGWPTVKDSEGKIRYLKICMLTDTKELAYEAQKLFTFNPPVLEGRNDDDMSLFYCAEKKKIDMIAKAQQNTQKYGCAKCIFKSACKEEFYLGTVDMILSQRFVLTTKSAILNRSSRLDAFDVVIMDESIRSVLQDEFVVDRNDIELFIMSLRKSKYWHNNKIKELSLIGPESKKYKESRIQELKNKNAINIIEKQIENCNSLLEIIEKNQNQNGYRLYYEFSAEYKFSEYIRIDVDDPRWDGIPDGNKKVVFVPPIFYGQNKAVWHTAENKILVKSINNKLIEKLSHKTVINLDATPIEDFCKLFPEYVINKTVVKEHVVIKSITDRKYAKTQLIKSPDYLSELIHATKELAKKHNTVGILTTKFIAERLRKSGVSDDMLGWYGRDTRGSNRMKNVDAIIMPGPYIENLSSVERDAEVLRMAGVETDTHSLIKQISSAETLQAIARGRGVQRSADNPLIVYKLTNQRIEGVTEHELYMNVYDMIEGIRAEARSSSKEAKFARQFWTKELNKHATGCEHTEEYSKEKVNIHKSGSNQAITQNGPHPSKLYKYNEIDQGSGGHFSEIPLLQQFQNPALFSKILNYGSELKCIAQSTWEKFIRAVKSGVTSIKDLATAIGISETTVKRLRRALMAILFPKDKEVSHVSKNEKCAIVANIINDNFDAMVAKVEKYVPPEKIAQHYEMSRGYRFDAVKSAYEQWLKYKYSDPDLRLAALNWYWYQVFINFDSTFDWLCKAFPTLVIDSLLIFDSH